MIRVRISFHGFQAGAPGFEPRSTDSKSGVLPLHHAPVCDPYFNINSSCCNGTFLRQDKWVMTFRNFSNLPSLATILADGNFAHLRCNFVALWPNQLPYQLGQREEYPKDWLQVPAHKNPIPDALLFRPNFCFRNNLDIHIG